MRLVLAFLALLPGPALGGWLLGVAKDSCDTTCTNAGSSCAVPPYLGTAEEMLWVAARMGITCPAGTTTSSDPSAPRRLDDGRCAYQTVPYRCDRVYNGNTHRRICCCGAAAECPVWGTETTTTASTSTVSTSTTSSSSSTVSSSSSTSGTGTSTSSSSSSVSSSSSSSTSGTVTTTGTTTSSSTSSSRTTSSTSTTSTSSTSTSTSTSSSTSSSTSTTSTSSTSTSTSTSSSTSSSSSSSTSSTSSTASTTSSSSSSSTSSSSSSSSGTSSTSSTSSSTTTVTSSSTSTRTSSTTSATSSSTSSSSLSSTSSSTSSSSSSSTSTTGVLSLAEQVKAAAKMLRKQMAGRASASAETPLGPLTLFSVATLLKEPYAGAVAAGESKVALTPEFLAGLPPTAAVGVLGFKEPPKAEGVEELATGSMDLSIFDDAGEAVEALPEPLLFRLPGGGNAPAHSGCAYLEAYTDANGATGVRWSTRGVRRASRARVLAANETDDGIWCETEHLSIFAGILNALLGCTNLELLTPAGMEALWLHENWWRSRPASLVFGVSGALLFVVGLGMLRELYALKLGRTHQDGKKVKVCRAFLSLGPQLCKHKYAAFVVFARDLVQCMRKGAGKLRKPTLTQGVQRCLAFRTGISTACVSQQCWNGAKWIDSTVSLPHYVLCHKLEFYSGGVEEVIARELRGTGPWAVARRLLIVFCACHPVFDATRLGAASLSARKRCVLLLAAFFGVLATNAMIFNFSGSQRSWEADAECPITPGSQLFIIVATCVSIVLNVVPNAFLLDVAKQVYGRPVWELAYWIVALGYMSMAFFVIIVALANLNEKDQEKWFASLRWACSIKFLGMPLAQALRNTVMLEHFLREDGKASHIETLLGLRHKGEVATDEKGRAAAETRARQAISAEELLHFVSLLGEKVMLGYSPGTSTSEEVLRGAVQLFGTPAAQEEALKVELLHAEGSCLPERLSCSVLHLGACESSQRRCLAELKCGAAAAVSEGRCSFDFKAEIEHVFLDHAVAFAVKEGDKVLGLACLSVEELVRKEGFEGELLLHHPTTLEEGRFGEPPMAKRVSGRRSVSASKGKEEEPEAGQVAVRVEVSHHCLQGMARRELSEAKRGRHTPEAHQEAHRKVLHSLAELRRDLGELRREVLAEVRAENKAFDFTTSAYSDPFKDGLKPPDRLVLHSRQGNFLELVASLLTDALGASGPEAMVEGGTWEQVHGKLLARDYPALLDMLRERQALEVRFWIDLFSLPQDPGRLRWHEELMWELPTIVRTLKRSCCRQMIADLRSLRPPSCGLPAQLLVLDRHCQLLKAEGLGELMLVGAMGLPQRMLLHPEHLRTPALGAALARLAKAPCELQKCPWVQPFLGAPGEAWAACRDLAVRAVRRLRDDRPETLAALGLAETAAFAAALPLAGAMASEESMATDATAGDVDVDV